MNHLTDEQLSAYLDGVFKGRDAEEAGRHLAGCQPCREALAELAEQDAALKPALKHDPGEAYFESFAARVEDRIRTAAPVSRAPGAGFDLGRWFRSPRALAWAGGAAVVVVGGGIALMTTRVMTPPDLRERDGMTQVAPAAPGGTAPPQENVPTPSADLAAPGAPSPQEAMPSPGALQEETAPSVVKPMVDAPAPEVRPASPARAFEVKRNEAGEEVPVRKLGATAGAPAPSPAPAAGADENARVRKKLAAQPMEAAKRAASGAASGPASGQTLSRLDQREQAAPAREGFAAGEARLCGDVRDTAGRPVAGAQVALTDLGRTATTDAAGRFCMRAPHGERTLSVMAVGYRETRQVVGVAGAESEVGVILSPVAVLDPRDDYASLPDTVRGMVREARRLEAEAAARGSAGHFEMAAGAWGRVLPRVAGGPLELETRRHVAETRFRAWETGPNASRARAAIEALTAYVTRAPAGPGRDQAIRWLDRVRL